MSELELLRNVAEAARDFIASLRNVCLVGDEAVKASNLVSALAALDAPQTAAPQDDGWRAADRTEGPRRENRIDPKMAERIWRVLVAECGCRDDLLDQQSFTHYLATEHWSGHEWRFQGALGFGGKFSNNSGVWRVDCYQEGRTPKRDEMIRRANEQIDALHAEYLRGATS